MVAIKFDKLAEFQDVPWGTIAWKGIYRSNRAVMEGFNGTIRDRNGLNAKSCRVFGIAAHTIAATAALVTYNIRLAREYGQVEFDDTPVETTADSADISFDIDKASPRQRPPP